MRALRFMRSGMLLALFLAMGCDGGDPVAPAQFDGPRPLGAGGMVCSTTGSSTVQVLDTGLELTLAFTVDREIGAGGGAFGIGASRMIVPAGAVAEPTLFTLNLTIGRNILADLTAVTVSTGAAVAAFAQPVTIEIGYQRLNGYEPSQLTLLWLVDGTIDGQLVEIATVVDQERKRILAELDHFSKYTVGIN